MAVPDLSYPTEASLKKIAYIFVLLTAAVLTVAGVEVEKFIPRQAPGIARIDINRMLTSPELKTVIEKNDKLKPLLDQVCEMFKAPTGQTVKSSDIFFRTALDSANRFEQQGSNHIQPDCGEGS